MSRVLVAVASAKGSHGATTLALALAARWTQPGAVLVECDADGGDLAYRFGHHPDPGLSSLAAACRAGAVDEPLTRHVQRLGLGVDVVLAPPGDAAAASVQTLAYAAGGVLARAGTVLTVVADVGRLTRGGPGLQLAATADHVLLVVAPELAELAQVGARLGWLREALRGRLWLVRVGSGRYSAVEMARDLGVDVAGEVPHDRSGAGVLSGRLVGRGWWRQQLPRAAAGIAHTLSGKPTGNVAMAGGWRVRDGALEVNR
ncbi:hypothetical protein [Virgisporangium aurantiacum]|uniref:MinD-like ATPase involved in chromosome partitioning or flagellar assembly n=1 Tax=Virgisporangium aurantiacum TaxID=175570 RepID=A0A8J3ZMQ9_9ACTN|nr:hypothetical protein [Virgisporangium aurantiacum]GIJ64386.1 hypothetical protein Vau01_119020 [Virgisporangium aurantiacum]